MKREFGLLLGLFSGLLVSATAEAEHPCDNVLEEAAQADGLDQAMSVLGSCLAARGPADMQFLVAGEMLRIAMETNDQRACDYARTIEFMVESPRPELDGNTVTKILDRARDQACYCDRDWARERAESEYPGAAAPSWFGWGGTHQSVLFARSRDLAGTRHKLLVNSRRGEDHVCVFGAGQLRHRESRGSATQGFKEGEFVALGPERRPAVVLHWRAGVHGETLQIVDLLQPLSRWERRSDWPLEYRIEDGRVHYTLRQTNATGDGLEAEEGVVDRVLAEEQPGND